MGRRKCASGLIAPPVPTVLTRCLRACPACVCVSLCQLIPAEPVDSMAAMKSFMDLNMLVTCDGKERSVQRHWRQLLDATRFRICSVTDTRSEYRILEAEPI